MVDLGGLDYFKQQIDEFVFVTHKYIQRISFSILTLIGVGFVIPRWLFLLLLYVVIVSISCCGGR